MFACRNNHAECARLLIGKGANVDATNKKRETARDIAVKYNKQSCVDVFDALDTQPTHNG